MLPFADPDDWPEGARSCSRSRGQTAGDRAPTAPIDRRPYCACWTARLVDGRVAGTGMYFGVPQTYDPGRDDVLVQYDDGYSAETPAKLFEKLAGTVGRLMGVVWDGRDRPDHRQQVIEAAMVVLAAIDGYR